MTRTRFAAVAIAVAACSPPTPPPENAAGRLLIPHDAVWRFRADASSQPGWLATDFDDAAWAKGQAPLGFGESALRTTTPNPTAQEPPGQRLRLRRGFELAEGQELAGLTAHYLRDDGLRLFLNGVEVLRHGLPAGELTASTPAARSVHGEDEDRWERLAIPADALRPGRNVAAAELYQDRSSGGDLRFALELRGHRVDDPPILTRGPYLQQTSRTGSVVRWQTAQPGQGWVEVGAAPGVAGIRIEESRPTRDHEIAVPLPAGAPAYYAIGAGETRLAGGDAQHVIARAGEAVRVWITGDQGSADERARTVLGGMLAAVGDRIPGAWITLGDNAYPSGSEAELQAAVFDTYADLLRRTTLWPSPGNHDLVSAAIREDEGPYFDVFSPPTAGEAGGVPSGRERWYAFDWGPVHVVSLDSVSGHRRLDSPMLAWLEADLAAADAPWIVAALHHPPHSRGSHDAEREVATSLVRERILPILEAHGTTVLFAGHSHSYERSRAVAPPVFVVAGHGSIPGDGPLDHPLMEVSRGGELGSILLDADACRLEVRAIDETGEVVDRFSLEKPAPCGR